MRRVFVKNLISAKDIKEEQRGEAMRLVSVMPRHMKALDWTLSDRLAIKRRHGTTMHLTKGEDEIVRSLAQRRLAH